MRLHQIAQHLKSTRQALHSWRKVSQKIALYGIDVRFVNCHPEITEVAQRHHDVSNITYKKANITRFGKATPLNKPERLGKMVQCHYRLHMPSMQVFEHSTIAFYSRTIPLALNRLNAAPFK